MDTSVRNSAQTHIVRANNQVSTHVYTLLYTRALMHINIYMSGHFQLVVFGIFKMDFHDGLTWIEHDQKHNSQYAEQNRQVPKIVATSRYSNAVDRRTQEHSTNRWCSNNLPKWVIGSSLDNIEFDTIIVINLCRHDNKRKQKILLKF